jgi:general secretion pathway protein A
MYETHFGFTASPFQLNPDPEFYFGSQGHIQALAHLRFGVQQGEGFIVITGEVGTGKTTLLRALMHELDPHQVHAAQIANTQLDADNLLQSILTAFGVPGEGLSKAARLSRLEAFLTSVAASGRRSLLVIDEAQNLSPQALEELRMLSNFQLGNHGLLQSFLVGQPELRDLLQLPSMRQLQQRVLASYHLGPLSVSETAAYVQHRLRQVGWSGQRPAIDARAYARLHTRTDGIPRRINVLCNRILLSAYLTERDAITAALVDETADEFGGESRAPAPVAMPETGSVAELPHPKLKMEATMPAVALNAGSRPEALPRTRKYKLAPGPLLVVAGDAMAWGQMQMLCRHWNDVGSAPEALVMVHAGASRSDVALDWRELEWGHPPVPCVYLECPASPPPRRAAALAVRFAELVSEVQPQALLLAGAGFDLMHLAVVAAESRLPVIRLGMTDAIGADDRAPVSLTNDWLNRAADLLLASSVQQHQRLVACGIPDWRTVRVGALTAALLHEAAPRLPAFAEAWAQLGLSQLLPNVADSGFAVLTAQVAPSDLGPHELLPWLTVVRHARDQLPLVWLVNAETADALAERSMQSLVRQAGITVVAAARCAAIWAVVARARCLIAGPASQHVAVAQALAVPACVVHPRGDGRAGTAGAGVVHLGLSQSRLVSEIRAVVQSRRLPTDPGGLPVHSVDEHMAQIRHWLKHRGALPFQVHPQTAAA